MRSLVAALIATVGVTGMASAQTSLAPVSADPTRGYVEGVAQSAFGNVTSQSFGAEVGVTVRAGIQAFVELGRVRDSSAAELGASAQAIAGFLSQTQSNVTFRVKQPVSFGLAGVRYWLSTAKLEPYVLGGCGVARVPRDVSFSVAGADVTNTMSQYGVVLGTDLSGSETEPMLTLGGGVAWPASQRIILDFQYRYGRVFTERGLNVNRAGLGLGVRF